MVPAHIIFIACCYSYILFSICYRTGNPNPNKTKKKLYYQQPKQIYILRQFIFYSKKYPENVFIRFVYILYLTVSIFLPAKILLSGSLD